MKKQYKSTTKNHRIKEKKIFDGVPLKGYLAIKLLAPLAKGQRAVVMALCPLCVRACIQKLFLQKTSPQKLLTGFLPNFTGMFLRWSSVKFLQIIVFYEEFRLPWRSK